MSQKSHNNTRQLRSHTKVSSSTTNQTTQYNTSQQIDEEIVASTYLHQENNKLDNSNNTENMDIDPINNNEIHSTNQKTPNTLFTTENNPNEILSQHSKLSPNHVTGNNITTQLINNTLENLPPIEDSSLNASFHAHNTEHNNNKGKNKEIDNPSITNQGLAPITKKHDFNYVTTSTNTDQQQQQIMQLPNYRQEDQNSDIIDISDVQLNTNQTQYIAFAPLNTFKMATFKQLKSSIRHVFNKKFNKDFAGILAIQNFKGIKIVKILFNDKQIRDSLHNVTISELNVKFYIYDQNNLNRVIEPYLETKRLNTIRIVDIPHYIDNHNILEFISDELGPINSFEEIIKTNSRDHNGYNGTRKYQKKQNFKQLKIEFSSKKSIENIMNQDMWSITYENFILRILPNETQADEFKHRTIFSYKITGIPISATT
ncbi:hypothetical protein C1645_740937 [Glomus cerebriforme]|uniref:Uncharacterized protein n=1 Tax=Glomus cerebriforme TaxID=658196 RepID=A0A397SKX5_9GLOM|nr:hypothetical protein C1645_740937 [Glomus cerebriforme]